MPFLILSYSPDDNLPGYAVHGATVSEIELDILTGEKLVRTCKRFVHFMKEIVKEIPL